MPGSFYRLALPRAKEAFASIALGILLLLAVLSPAACAQALKLAQAMSAGEPGQTQEATAAKPESVHLDIDAMRWQKILDKNKPDESHTVEYVPKDQTADTWNEIVTIQTFPAINRVMNSQQMKDAFVQRVKDLVGSKYTFTTNTIELPGKDAEKDLLFEWIIESGPDAQHGLERCITGADALYVLHYCARPSMSDDKRSRWLDTLKQAKLVH